MSKTIKQLLKLGLILTFSLTFLTGCGNGNKDDKVIKVGASPSPHAEILEAIKPEIEKEGYELQIVEFEDYVKPNQALSDKDLDANYFQHQPYLDDYNKKNNTNLVGIKKIHYEPLGIYKAEKKSIDELSSGDKIGVPNDTTNEARALLLLEEQGIIELKKDAGLQATKADIINNPKNIEIVELDAAIIPQTLPDLAIAVINGNFAISSGLKSDDAIIFESNDSKAAQEYANVIAVRKEDKKSNKTKALLKALQSDTAKNFIKNEYNGAVVAIS